MSDASEENICRQYKEGGTCPKLGTKIHTIILNLRDFTVYLDDEFFVWWVRHTEKNYPPNFWSIVNRMSYFETISATHFSGLPTENKELEEYRRLLGEGVARALGGDEAAASEILDRAEYLLRDRSVQRARVWYISAATLMAGLAVLFALWLWWERGQMRVRLGPSAFDILLCASAGALGALVSTINRVPDVNLNASSGPTLHYIEGAARILVGLIGAFLVALAIKGDLFLGVVNNAKTSVTRLALLGAFCFVAGASERLVPNLIRQIENGAVSGDKAATHGESEETKKD